MRSWPATLIPVLAAVLCAQDPGARSQEVLGAPDPAALAARLGSRVRWVADDPQAISEGSRASRRQVLESLREHRDFDRAAALDKALKTARERNRLVLWYVPRIAGRQMYRPAVLDLYAQAVFFTDPEVVALINHKLVPVRLICDPPLQERTGIRPPSPAPEDPDSPARVEPLLVFMAPDGSVLHVTDQIRTFNPYWLRGQIQRLLAEHPGYDRPVKSADGGDALAGARDLIEAGDFPEARGLLKELLEGDPNTERRFQAHMLLARAARLAGELDAAMNQLERTEALLEEDLPRRRVRALRSSLACERGRVHLAAGRCEEAARQLSLARRGQRAAEALYHLGLAQTFLGRHQDARRSWRWATGHEEDPHAWRAAANLLSGRDLTPVGPAPHGFEDPFLPAQESYARPDTALPVAGGEERQLARRAVDYLLRIQRADGGWKDSRYAYWMSPDLTPNVWVAATALSCAALLDWRELDPGRIDAAIEKGEAYIFDEDHMARGSNEEVYAEAFKLLYLVRRHETLPADSEQRAALVERMEAVAERLRSIQDDQGFWAHEYPNAFCTAAAMDALRQARRLGATVPQVMLIKGAEALLGIRSEKTGAYAYSGGRPPSSPKDSMARSPICEAVILWAGHEAGAPEKVAAALETFREHFPRLHRVRHCDFHTDGELAGFFYWHGLYLTATALEALPPDQRGDHRDLLLEEVRRVGELDGSFVDSHELGKSYGTAMGLMTLSLLLEETP